MSTGVWLYDRDDDASRRGAAIVAMDRLEEPQLDVEVLATRGDHLTVQVVRGALEDPTAILYVEQRGEFELVRVERWPAVGGPPRVLLTLRAWPQRNP
jgi:hypothetical protein